MLGYSQTGYRLWNVTKTEVFVSRDVRFDENNYYKIKEGGPNIYEHSNDVDYEDEQRLTDNEVSTEIVL